MPDIVEYDCELGTLIMVPDEIVATLLARQTLLKKTLDAAFPDHKFMFGIDPQRTRDFMIVAVKPNGLPDDLIVEEGPIPQAVQDQIVSLLDAFCERRREMGH